MSIIKHYKNKRKKRHRRVRGKIKGTAERPRLSVFRSNRRIYCQLIDDERGITLAAASDLATAEKYAESVERSPRREVAYQVGKSLARRALKEGVKTAVFDRGGYRYHGRVKALAEGARDGGLEF